MHYHWDHIQTNSCMSHGVKVQGSIWWWSITSQLYPSHIQQCPLCTEQLQEGLWGKSVKFGMQKNTRLDLHSKISCTNLLRNPRTHSMFNIVCQKYKNPTASSPFVACVFFFFFFFWAAWDMSQTDDCISNNIYWNMCIMSRRIKVQFHEVGCPSWLYATVSTARAAAGWTMRRSTEQMSERRTELEVWKSKDSKSALRPNNLPTYERVMNFLEPQMYSYSTNVFWYSRKRHHSIDGAVEDHFAGVYHMHACSSGSIAVTAENTSSSISEACWLNDTI